MSSKEKKDNVLGELYGSKHCRLFDIEISGKKCTAGVLRFKGIPSIYGNATEVHAIASGVVMRNDRCYNHKSRESRLGHTLTIYGSDGVAISYERLAGSEQIKEGDYINAGQVIGTEGDSGAGKGQYLQLRFSKNGRLVDGCEYLGIKRKPAEYSVDAPNAEEAVCRICRLDSNERYSICTLPCADTIWQKIVDALAANYAPQIREETTL